MGTIMEHRILNALRKHGSDAGLRTETLADLANVAAPSAAAVLDGLELDGKVDRTLASVGDLVTDVWTLAPPERPAREDRDLMMECRVLHALRARPNDMLAAGRIASLANVRVETALRLLKDLHSRGTVSLSKLEIEGNETELWQIVPTPATGDDEVEARVFDALLSRGDAPVEERTTLKIAEAVGLRAGEARCVLEDLESAGVVHRTATNVDGQVQTSWTYKEETEVAVAPDLPPGWTLMPADAITADLDTTDLVAVCGDGEGDCLEWQVARAPVDWRVFVLTDVPHPDDPDEDAVFMFDFCDAVDELMNAIVPDAGAAS